MARKVFFSFYYERDILRVGQIRNSGIVLAAGDTSSGFTDAASWESVRKQGDDAVRKWINGQMEGTSVTVVLIGAETAQRPWVNYEITKSIERGNGLLGIHIHNVRDLNQKVDVKGMNPFDYVTWKATGRPISDTYPTYDWVNDDGRRNLASWVEAAAKKAGR